MRTPIIGIMILLGGCSSFSGEDAPVKTLTQVVFVNEKPAGKDTTLYEYSNTRTGAAYNQEGYRHVLSQRETVTLADHAPVAVIQPRESTVPAVPSQIRSYTVYENARWSRFCGHGKMTEADWDFVATEGRDRLPEHLQENCQPPAFTRQDYLTAWSAGCGAGEVSESNRIIRDKTEAPAEACAAG